MRRRDFLQQSAIAAAAASVPVSAFAARPSAGGDFAKVHADALVIDGLSSGRLDEKQIALFRQGGVNCAIKGAGGLAGHGRLNAFIETHAESLAKAVTVRDIRQAKRDGKTAIVYEWQSAEPLVEETDIAGALRAYHDLGLRIVGIAYNNVNIFGGGSLEPTFGLTRAGRRLVETIHKNAILLDVGGHTAEQAGFDAIEISRGVPVVCTHTNVRALNDNPRCMTDKLIEAIAATGGMIGITAFSDFMARNRTNNTAPRTPQVGLDKYLDQFDYVKKLVGVDHVGVAADNVEGMRAPPEKVAQDMPPEAYSEQPWFYAKGFETIAEYPNVTKGLLDRGWPVEDVRKVLGENWLRVYQRVWGA